MYILRTTRTARTALLSVRYALVLSHLNKSLLTY